MKTKKVLLLIAVIMIATTIVVNMAVTGADIEENDLETSENSKKDEDNSKSNEAAVENTEQEEFTIPVFESVDFNHGTVTASYLNMRLGPSTQHQVARILTEGRELSIIGKMGEWYAAIDLKTGNMGCVHSTYISIPDSETPVAGTVDEPVTANDDVIADTNEEVQEVEDDQALPILKLLDVSSDEEKMLELINSARQEEGLALLEFDEELLRVARLKAQDMADNNYFSHESSEYGTPWAMMKRYDIIFKTAGENIAGNKTVEGAFNAWIESDDHKRNILNEKFNYTGIGIVESSDYGYVFVQQFIGK